MRRGDRGVSLISATRAPELRRRLRVRTHPFLIHGADARVDSRLPLRIAR